jgi:hypothetical protein
VTALLTLASSLSSALAALAALVNELSVCKAETVQDGGCAGGNVRRRACSGT